MLLRMGASRRPFGFVEPCRPSRAPRPPSGPSWVHEIKHDGFRLMVRREGARVRCFTRGAYDSVGRFPAIVEAASTIRAQSFLIDGEAVVCRHDGLSDFNALRSRRRGHEVTLIAFDLIEWQGNDLRDSPLEQRKQRLAKMKRPWTIPNPTGGSYQGRSISTPSCSRFSIKLRDTASWRSEVGIEASVSPTSISWNCM
jgi:ATP-dependent DNA ligase